MTRLWRSFSFLRALQHPDPAIIVNSQQTRISGIAVDSYLPPTQSDRHAAIIFSHGFNVEGGRDKRVIQLCKAFSSVGFKVFAPNYPKAMQLEIDANGLTSLLDVIELVQQDPIVDIQKIGLMGASYGGTLGLLALSKQNIAKTLAWVVTLGAYGSLSNVVEYGATGLYQGTKLSLTPDPYSKKIFEKNFGSLDSPENIRNTQKKYSTLFDTLSVGAKTLYSPSNGVLLFHSPNDNIIPFQESELLLKKLATDQISTRHYSLELGGHAKMPGLPEFFSAFRAIYQILKIAKC